MTSTTTSPLEGPQKRVTSMPFDPEYVSRVLRENFEDAKALFLSPLIAIHYAHLIMLRERGIVSEGDARIASAAAARSSCWPSAQTHSVGVRSGRVAG